LKPLPEPRVAARLTFPAALGDRRLRAPATVVLGRAGAGPAEAAFAERAAGTGSWRAGSGPINAMVDVTNLFTFGLGAAARLRRWRRCAATRSPCAWRARARRLGGAERQDLRADAGGRHPSPTRRGPEALAASSAASIRAATRAPPNASSSARCSTRCGIALSGRRHDVRTERRSPFERGRTRAGCGPALKRRTALDARPLRWRREASEVESAGDDPEWRRGRPCVRALPGSAEPMCRDEAWPSWSASASRCQRGPGPGHGVRAVLAQRRARPPSHLAQAARRLPPIARAQRPRLCGPLVEAGMRLGGGVMLRIRGLTVCRPSPLPVADPPLPRPSLTPKQARTALARRVLGARGMLECVSFAFMAGRHGGAVQATRRSAAASPTRSRPTWTRCGRPPSLAPAGGGAQRGARDPTRR
jgi:phenylalanyl-tRNA synthetase beta chain